MGQNCHLKVNSIVFTWNMLMIKSCRIITNQPLCLYHPQKLWQQLTEAKSQTWTGTLQSQSFQSRELYDIFVHPGYARIPKKLNIDKINWKWIIFFLIRTLEKLNQRNSTSVAPLAAFLSSRDVPLPNHT